MNLSLIGKIYKRGLMNITKSALAGVGLSAQAQGLRCACEVEQDGDGGGILLQRFYGLNV